jgi:hypothetical protein
VLVRVRDGCGCCAEPCRPWPSRFAETKGLEDISVANKDRAAHLWAENTTKLTEKPWAYVKVLQTAYKQLQPTRFEDLLVLEQKKFL